jgi:uroporphyrinogen decarboxylase
MMRQAGRYLPQYREVRGRTTFLGLCKSPDLACEVTMQPIDELGMDAAILFSDILIPLEAMGLPLEFTEEGPVLPQPVRDAAAAKKLRVPDPEDTMPFVPEAVRRIRKALAGRVPLIGFAGAPFTLASYAVEGRGSKNFTVTKKLLYSDPEAAHALLGKIGSTVVRYLEAQVAAGAEALQLFDTWAGVLSPRDFDEFALRYVRAVIAELRASRVLGGVPIIYFVNGAAPYLEQIRGVGADVVGLDWKMDLAWARGRLGADVAVQGNLDPAALFLPPLQIEERVREVLRQAGSLPGHIFNLGHGVFPETPVEHVRCMIDAVKKYGVSQGA